MAAALSYKQPTLPESTSTLSYVNALGGVFTELNHPGVLSASLKSLVDGECSASLFRTHSAWDPEKQPFNDDDDPIIFRSLLSCVHILGFWVDFCR